MDFRKPTYKSGAYRGTAGSKATHPLGGAKGTPGTTKLTEPFDTWDVTRAHHVSTHKALVPLQKKWSRTPSAGQKSKVTLDEVVRHLAEQRRYFSHELPSQYFGHAIGQGGVQSGFRTTRALGLPEPRHDKGRAAAGFVFTRQLPSSKKVKTTLTEGQVGAKSDAMLVFKPSMFSDPGQMTFFKSVDGAHRSDSIVPHKAMKGDHIRSQSDSFARSADPVFHANQEQGTFGSIPLHHLGAVVLKSKAGREAETKEAFIDSLMSTHRGGVLPPTSDRAHIKAGATPDERARRFASFQERVVGQTLYDHFEEQLNVNTPMGARRRRVEDVVLPLSEGTARSDVADRIPKERRSTPVHERRPGLGKPNPAFFQPRDTLRTTTGKPG